MVTFKRHILDRIAGGLQLSSLQVGDQLKFSRALEVSITLDGVQILK